MVIRSLVADLRELCIFSVGGIKKFPWGFSSFSELIKEFQCQNDKGIL
jgi:hypothetical protein